MWPLKNTKYKKYKSEVTLEQHLVYQLHPGHHESKYFDQFYQRQMLELAVSVVRWIQNQVVYSKTSLIENGYTFRIKCCTGWD